MYSDEFLEEFFYWDMDYNLWDYDLCGQDEFDVFAIFCAGQEL